MNSIFGYNELENTLNKSTNQWIIAISVCLLIALYVNAFGYINLYEDKILQTSPSSDIIYQLLSTAILSLTLISLLFFFYIYFNEMEKMGSGVVKIRYSKILSTLKNFNTNLIIFFPLRVILYAVFIIFWFAVKYSYRFTFPQIKCIDLGPFSVYGWVFICFIFFICIIELPLVLACRYFNNAIRRQKTKNIVDLEYI